MHPSVVLLGFLGVCSASSLMKRIREQQGADESAHKGLEMGGDGWLQVPQPLQDVLMSIDDKLRGLDTFGYTLKLARLDFSLDQLARRMENIETKLGRLETKFDLRMEKVEEVVVSKDLKEEFSNEHLSRRIEILGDRVSTKAAYIDTKLERVADKLELLERDLHGATEDILERIIKADDRQGALEVETAKREERLDQLTTNVNTLKIFVKEDLSSQVSKSFEELSSKLNTIQSRFENGEIKSELALSVIQTSVSGARERVLGMLQDSSNKIDSLSAALTSVDRSRSKQETCEVAKTITQEQLDNLTLILENALALGEARFRELDSDVEQYARKVINGIQELWKTSDELKLDLLNSLEQSSRTRELVRHEFQRLHWQIEPLPKLEPRLTSISEELNKKVVELSVTVDSSFATLLVAQNAFIDSCHRVQQEETHVYDILQQVVHEMRNRSIADIHRITAELRNQSTQINKSLAHVLTAVLLTGNITTNAVNDLVMQLRQKDHCIILKADSLKLNAMESICSQLAEDKIYAKNTIGAATQDSNYLMRTENRRTYDDSDNEESIVGINDYELDYKISDTEYKDI